MYLGEQQGGITPTGSTMPAAELNEASNVALGYAELRTVLDARRLPGKFELHLDARVRITPDEVQNDPVNGDPSLTVGAGKVIARGYFGGREYEVKQAYVRRRGEKIDFALGRLIVPEADALRLDGARLWWRVAPHWDVSGFAGAYPNPFSRSVTTDYSSFSFAGGADSSYTYDKIWGAFSVVGAYLGGLNDGGPLNLTALPNLGNYQTETARSYITWNQFMRLASWFDFYHDLVVDVSGSAGAQLTRADLLATIRAGKYFTLHLGYDHLSSLAIEMYLFALLNNRQQFVANTIENNLIVERTARDQGRLQADVTIKKVSIFAEGMVRYRALQNPGEDPQFTGAGNTTLVPQLAWDFTVGLRDRGTFKAIRAGAWLSYLADFRANSIIFDLDFGRSFFDERLSIDAAFLYSRTKDQGAGSLPTCNLNPSPFLAAALLAPSCYGDRDGAEYEVGLTVSGSPWKRWLGLLDYRLVVDETTGKPDILTHMLLLRVEARY